MSTTSRGHDHRKAGQGAVGGSPTGRIPVSFVAWGAVSGRSREIADALGGEAHCLFPPEASWRPHALIRYPLCALNTVFYLLRRRPRSVVVTNPPVIAGLVVLLCAKLIDARVVLDSHPGGFGAQGDTKSAKLQWLHKWLVRHVDGVAVASVPWVEIVDGWGGTAMEVHEAPGDLALVAPAPVEKPVRPLQVLCVGRLAPDEPSGEVIEAARAVPDCQFLVTGDRARAPELVASAPANVTFVGFLGPDEYRAALLGGDVVMTLTTEPSSVMRAAYEAVYAEQPLIVTDWPIGRTLFTYAEHVDNDAVSIAEGVRRMHDDLPRYRAVAAEARVAQLARWEAQLNGLRGLLGLPTNQVGSGARGDSA
jgi:glycosyltransferase involved in cell wall biosynthesis